MLTPKRKNTQNANLNRRQWLNSALLAASAGTRLSAGQAPVPAPSSPKPPAQQQPPTAYNIFEVDLPPLPYALDLRPDSPFGINMAMNPTTPNAEARLKAMQEAGIKWGRQTMSWRTVEPEKGRYLLDPWDPYIDLCRKHGLSLVGNLTGLNQWHDPRTPEGVEAYCRMARALVTRFRAKIQHWQIWNEPNGGSFWPGTTSEYARLLASAGKTIHQTDPSAKVLGLNMAFCDVRWAERVLKQVPFDSFDILCFHPYRPPSTPEERYDWWIIDQYVGNWHRQELSENYPLAYLAFVQQTQELARVVERFGPRKPFWVTEMNWNTPACPFGTQELRQSDLLVRFYVLAIASGLVEKIFPWTLTDNRNRQYSMADMVGLMRHNLVPKYAYYAHAWMARMLEGNSWERNDVFGPDVYSIAFRNPKSDERTLVAWTVRPYAYLQLKNENGLTIYDVYGCERFIPKNPKSVQSVIVPLSDSPVYIVGFGQLFSQEIPNPGLRS
ncbi:MAG: hypothetical protein ACUVXB_13615 [Bryobacteraceae bacterium]